MSCSQCEKQYMQNLDHMRILAKQCAELTQTDQIIFKVNGRVPHYGFAPTASGEIIETIRFDRHAPDIDILSDNEVAGLEPPGDGGETQPGKAIADLGGDNGAILPGGEPEDVPGTVKKSRKNRAAKKSDSFAFGSDDASFFRV